MGTRADRRDDLVRLCGGKDELDVRRRFLDSLSSALKPAVVTIWALIDDVDLEAAADR
jgi:hypothetical protein